MKWILILCLCTAGIVMPNFSQAQIGEHFVGNDTYQNRIIGGIAAMKKHGLKQVDSFTAHLKENDKVSYDFFSNKSKVYVALVITEPGVEQLDLTAKGGVIKSHDLSDRFDRNNGIIVTAFQTSDDSDVCMEVTNVQSDSRLYNYKATILLFAR